MVKTNAKNKLKRTGAKTQPCVTPFDILKGVDIIQLQGVKPDMMKACRLRILLNSQAKQDDPCCISTNYVEYFSQVITACIEIHLLLTTLFLHLPYSENHADGAVAT